jgi:hypothetical protein
MTRPAAAPSALADPVEVFTARAEARAYLWSEGELDLHSAVDVLQHDAERSGLVELIGQDRVQAIMAKAFRAVRRPYIVEAVDEVADPSPEPEPPPKHRAADATVDALMHGLRSRGVAALAERDHKLIEGAQPANTQILKSNVEVVFRIGGGLHGFTALLHNAQSSFEIHDSGKRHRRVFAQT